MPESKPLRVAIACNIKTNRSTDIEAEFDEPETVEAIANALRQGGYEPVVVEATSDFPQNLEAAAPDIVFNIAEGQEGPNREAQVPALLEALGIPYTGSDALTLAQTLSKALTNQVAQNHSIKTPACRLIPPAEASASIYLGDKLDFPVLVKPNAEGSSKGISDDCVAQDLHHLRTLVESLRTTCAGDLLVEQYIDGREFTVGVLGNGDELRIFEPMEIIYNKLRGSYKVYSYEVKRNFRDYISYECPSSLEIQMIKQLKHDAEAIYRIFGCRDYARLDFRLAADNQVYFIEINPIPGLAPDYSDYPMLAAFNGMEYDELICTMLESALKRLGSGRETR